MKMNSKTKTALKKSFLTKLECGKITYEQYKEMIKYINKQ